MSGSTRRTTEALKAIQSRTDDIGRRVAAAVGTAVAAALAGDMETSSAVVLGDLAINRDVRALDAICHRFVAIHLPSAGHLRFVSSVLRLNVGLERIGDQAVTIAREALQLGGPPPLLLDELAAMARQSSEMLERALRSWETRDVSLARETMGMAGAVDMTLADILRTVLDSGASAGVPLADLYALLVVFSSLERISDQAKNVCEETVFTVTGETKAPKVYRILFVDQDNAGRGQLAQAIAAKIYPSSGEFHSAGLVPAPRIDAGLAELMDRWGLVLPNARPQAAPADARGYAGYHVVVALGAAVARSLPTMPFHTVPLTWTIGDHPGPDPLDPGVQQRFAELYRQLAGAIGALMLQLRGDDAR